MSKRQLHWSHISMLQRCGIQYQYRYLQGSIKPPGVALIVGSATHESIEDNMKHKRDSGDVLPAEAVAEKARESVNHRWQSEGVALDAEEKSEGEANVRGQAVDMAVTLSRLHHSELAPIINPVHVERKWVLEMDNFPFDLSGTIDLQEPTTIRDTKTAKRSPPENTAHGSDQLTIYALAATILDGKTPDLRLDSLVKTKTPKVVTQETTRDESDFQVMLRRIEAASRQIETGAFIPAPSDSWQCSAKFCGYWNECPYSRKRVQV